MSIPRFLFTCILILVACLGVDVSAQATLPAFHTGPWSNNVPPAGWTFTGLGTPQYADYDGAGFGAGKLDTSGDMITVNFDSAPGTVAYWIKGNTLSGAYVFKVEESADGGTWSDVVAYNGAGITSSAVPTTNALLSASRFVRFNYVTKVGGNVGVDGIAISSGGPAVFQVTLDKADGFQVIQGTSTSVTATAANGTAPYTYGWSSTLGGTYYTAVANVFTILGTAPTGSFTATATATDAAAQSTNKTVSFSVVTAPTTYPITITPPTHGTVSTTPATETTAGTTVTITATPDSGYQADTITVVDAAMNPVTVTGNTFTMPAAGVTVTVTFTSVPAEGILAYRFTSAPHLQVTTKDANVDVSAMSISAGTIETNITSAAFPNPPLIEETGGWNGESQAAAKCYQFTITPQVGYPVTINGIFFRAYATSAGPSGMGYNIGGGLATYEVNAPSAALLVVSQAVVGVDNQTSPIVVQIQGWTNGSRASSGAGVFRLDDVVIYGTVSSGGGIDNPSAFSATGGNAVVDLAWTANASNDVVMIAYNTSSTFGAPSGTYGVGNEIAGGGKVIFRDRAPGYQQAGLTNGQAYYYRAWSVRGETNYSSGVAASATPWNGVNNPSGVTATGSNAAVTMAWTLNANSDPVMVAYNTTSIFGEPSGTYSVGGEILGGGKVLYMAGGTGFQQPGLTNGQTYWFRAWSVATGPEYSSGYTVSATPVSGPLQPPGILAASSVSSNHFTANWTAPEGATSYLLDVATNEAFRYSAGRRATDLNPGDLMIVTVNARTNTTSQKGFDAVPLVDLDPGATIMFTDNGWSNGTWRTTSEGVVTYVAPGAVTAGTVLSYRNVNENGFTKTGSFDLSVSGDNILVYQGSAEIPLFVYGIGWSSATPWVTNGANVTGNNSEIPPALSVEAFTIATLGRSNNYQYVAANGTTGSKAELLQKAATSGNWVGSSFDAYAKFTPDFTVGGGGAANDFVPGYRNRPVSGTSEVVTGLVDNFTYYYRVRAVSASETSGYSAITNVTTGGGTPSPTYESWAVAHGLDPASPSGQPGANYDSDADSNYEEFVADTDPTNPNSCFPYFVTNFPGTAVITIWAGPPTTNSRIYDVWVATNLRPPQVWTGFNFNRRGADNGSAIGFTVTNTGAGRFYRSGVKVP